jgi:predicted transcriptional regulator
MMVQMKTDYENSAKEFLEIASEQRLAILLKLNESKSTISVLAKEFEATVPEVYRNFERLVKADLIMKNSDGDYSITTYGKIVCGQISAIRFISENKKYFKNHDFGDVPQKFLQRIGSLERGKQIKGYVKVMEKWQEIYKNANEYICNILYEVPYTADLMEPLIRKVESGVKLHSILSESAIIPKDRKQMLEKLGIKKLIEKGLVERKMTDDVSVVIILNEKEGCIMFPSKTGEVDLSEGFYGDELSFQEWCADYFDYCWTNAKPFQESKMKRD